MKTILKKLSALLCLILAVLFACTVAGCAARGDYDGYSPGAPGGSGSSGDALYVPSESGAAGEMAPGGSFDVADGVVDGSVEKPSEGGGSQPVIAKQLTGAEWRDALDYEFWLKLFEKDVPIGGQQQGEQTTRDGLFCKYATATRGLDSFDMHEVSVTCDGSPVVGAAVKLFDGDDVVYSAITDSAGKAYVFGDGTRVEVASGEYHANASVAEGTTNIELTNFEACENELEIMLVVDTTGSMGDELSFLCNELAGVVTRISASLQCKIRLGLLFYRDKGDEYVTRKFDFVDVSSSNGLDTVLKNIGNQRSAGGGDYPEAVDTALSEAVAADWHTNSKTRLIFHVLDAPYHDEQENQSKFANAVKAAAQKGIRVIPVAASGLDVLGQYIMRSAALLTGGTYAFLTDDSGIGDRHELPAVGEFTVEYLSDLMVRLIKGYYTGTFEEPILWKQSESVVR